MRRRDAAVLLASAAVLAYQVVLVRAFAIGQWHHFAYMVISIALLGFGASGSLLALLERRKAKSEKRKAEAETAPAIGRGAIDVASAPLFALRFSLFDSWFAAAAALFALTLPVCFWLSQKIPFDPFLIVWDGAQLLYLGAYYAVLFVPFFFAATAIGLALTGEPERSAATYAYNLAGSGLGAAAGVLLLVIAPVERAVLAVAALAQGAAVLALLDAAGIWRDKPAVAEWRRKAAATTALAAMAAVTLYFAAQPPAVRISQYKGLSYALNLPAAEIVAQRWGPLGRVDVVRSPALRHAPGLSLAAPPEAIPPSQLGLYVDAESAGAITAFDGDTAKLAYLDWMTTAAPYAASAQHPQRALVLGAGGGAGVLLALRHGAREVDSVELDANVIELMRTTFREFSGALYDRPGVRVRRAEARAFVEAAREQWDVIDVSLVDSFAAAAAGAGAVGENYLYTREALETMLARLAPGGRLAITRWVRTPPRDALKMLSTAVAALEALGLPPAERVAMVRGWATVTLLVARDPFSLQERAALASWAEERLFDFYAAGPEGVAPARFNLLERDHYAEAMRAILTGGARRDTYFREYAFDIRPATDDRPYFFHFFRLRALPEMLRAMGAAWIPFVEWGYLILLATLAQAAVFGVILILLPLWLLRGKAEDDRPSEDRATGRYTEGAEASRAQVFTYFLALGLGFLFVEIVLIQRLTFFLGDPVYAVAVVLAGLLLFSGAGSGWAARRLQAGATGARLAVLAALMIAGVALVYAPGLHAALRPLVGWPLGARIGIALATMAPLAAMGIPFPMGLRQVGAGRAELLPWAWAINGCASVAAGPLATLVAMNLGMPVLLASAAGCYLAAAGIARRWYS
jgi:spermidine synthase